MIWGAAGGIGRALTQSATERGYQVIALSRTGSDVDGNGAALDVDVSRPYSVQAAVAAAARVTDTVDLWVYCVGDITAEDTETMQLATWQRIVDANLTGAYLAAHYSLPLLAPNGHLIFVGAVNERLRLPGLSAYAAAKAGLEAFADALRKELRGRRVAVVRPVAVNTPFWDKVPMNMPRDAGTPDEAAARILAVYDAGETAIVPWH